MDVPTSMADCNHNFVSYLGFRTVVYVVFSGVDCYLIASTIHKKTGTKISMIKMYPITDSLSIPSIMVQLYNILSRGRLLIDFCGIFRS